jgi:hypothetical protein
VAVKKASASFFDGREIVQLVWQKLAGQQLPPRAQKA